MWQIYTRTDISVYEENNEQLWVSVNAIHCVNATVEFSIQSFLAVFLICIFNGAFKYRSKHVMDIEVGRQSFFVVNEISRSLLRCVPLPIQSIISNITYDRLYYNQCNRRTQQNDLLCAPISAGFLSNIRRVGLTTPNKTYT